MEGVGRVCGVVDVVGCGRVSGVDERTMAGRMAPVLDRCAMVAGWRGGDRRVTRSKRDDSTRSSMENEGVDDMRRQDGDEE